MTQSRKTGWACRWGWHLPVRCKFSLTSLSVVRHYVREVRIPGDACSSPLLYRLWLKVLMGRDGAASLTSLLNIGEEHLTSMWRRASSFLKPTGSQTTFLTPPRKGIDLSSPCLWRGFSFLSSRECAGSPERFKDETEATALCLGISGGFGWIGLYHSHPPRCRSHRRKLS